MATTILGCISSSNDLFRENARIRLTYKYLNGEYVNGRLEITRIEGTYNGESTSAYISDPESKEIYIEINGNQKTILLDEHVVFGTDGWYTSLYNNNDTPFVWEGLDNASEITITMPSSESDFSNAVFRGDITMSLAYTIRYELNGGSGLPSNTICIDGESTYVTHTRPIKTGYDFLGWSTSPNSSVEYKSGDEITLAEDIMLYAIWQPKTYTVTYDANGGENAPSPTTGIHDKMSYITSERPTRIGYHFLGWDTSPDNDMSYKYSSGSVIVLTSDITLYAIWMEKNGKDKVVTVESLASLHKHNKETYATKKDVEYELENIFNSGITVLSSYQYGDELPEAGTVGRVFFKRLTDV